MKRATLVFVSLIFGLLIGLPSASMAQDAAKKKMKLEDSPNIAWNKSKHIFGSIVHKKPVSVDFEFTNNTTEAVAITKVGTTCGCTAPVYSKEPVKVGEKGKVKIKFDAMSPGFFKKAAKIHFSNGSAKEVEIEGKVTVRRQDIKKSI